MAGAAAATKPSRARPQRAPQRPLRSVAPPRRVSGPAGGIARPRADRRPDRSLAAAALAAFGELTRHPLLERLIRGRWSIALVAFALIGIVTLQLGLLQLNAGIGRTLVRERVLERENASLSIENSALASGERIQQLAARLGMAPTGLSDLRFLPARHGNGLSAKAAATLRAPVHRSEGEATGAASQQALAGSQGGEPANAVAASSGAAAEAATAAGATSGTEAGATSGTAAGATNGTGTGTASAGSEGAGGGGEGSAAGGTGGAAGSQQAAAVSGGETSSGQ